MKTVDRPSRQKSLLALRRRERAERIARLNAVIAERDQLIAELELVRLSIEERRQQLTHNHHSDRCSALTLSIMLNERIRAAAALDADERQERALNQKLEETSRDVLEAKKDAAQAQQALNALKSR